MNAFACNSQDPSAYSTKLLSKEPTLVANFSRAQGAIKRDDTPRFVLVSSRFALVS